MGGDSTSPQQHLSSDQASKLYGRPPELDGRLPDSKLWKYIDRESNRLSKKINLDKRVKSWHAQRLWSINLAPELVAHDDQHAQSVERLLSELVGAWRNKGQFTDDELVSLSVAAWLHDWGHIGGTITQDQRDQSDSDIEHSQKFFDQSIYVRELHGLISQSLLDECKKIHDVPRVYAEPAAILCGHHQGWTSFDRDNPVAFGSRKDDKTEMAKWREERRSELSDQLKLKSDFAAPSFWDDVSKMYNAAPKRWGHRNKHMTNENDCYARMRFLLALLRVADGADLGIHRVPGSVEKKAAFLGRCLYRESLNKLEKMRSSEFSEKNHDFLMDRLDEVVTFAERVTRTGDWSEEPWRRTSWKDLKDPVLVGLKRYAIFLKDQDDYFMKHQLVKGVRFKEVQSSRSSRYKDVDVIVWPMRKDQSQQALDHVVKDVRRELNRSDVRGVIDGARCRMLYVRDAYSNAEKRDLRDPQ